MRIIKIKEGALWESFDWELVVDYISEYALCYDIQCPHMTFRPDLPTKKWETGFRYSVPLVAILKNEGGYNSTGLCLLCAMAHMDDEKDA